MNKLESIYDKLTQWFNDFNKNEVTELVSIVNKTEDLLIAAESIPEEKCKQFVDNFIYDLKDFHQQYQAQIKHSLYLSLLQENFWRTLADITDKSQVEWAELQEDIEHKGLYQQGDFIGFGELECIACHETLLVTHFMKVDVCLKCHGTRFHRKMLSA